MCNGCVQKEYPDRVSWSTFKAPSFYHGARMLIYYTSKVTASYWRYNYPWVTLIFGSTNSLKRRCCGVTSIRWHFKMSLRGTKCWTWWRLNGFSCLFLFRGTLVWRTAPTWWTTWAVPTAIRGTLCWSATKPQRMRMERRLSHMTVSLSASLSQLFSVNWHVFTNQFK